MSSKGPFTCPTGPPPPPCGPYGLGMGTLDCPFLKLQQALDVAPDGHTIIVAPGIHTTRAYPGRGRHRPIGDDRELQFIIDKNVIVRSETPSDPTIANATILAGPILFTGGQDANCLLTGFRIEDRQNGSIYGNHTEATLSHCFTVPLDPAGICHRDARFCQGTRLRHRPQQYL